MVIFFLSAVLFVSTVALPIEKDRQAEILQYKNNVDENGNYHFSYQTSNGIFRSEDGHFIDNGKSEKQLVVEGYFSYTDPDGELHSINYKADENGYQILPAIGVGFGLPAAAVATLLG